MNPLDWLIPWEPSVTVATVTALTLVIYARGCFRTDVSLWQKALFITGLLSLYAVSHTQFDYYAEHEFFMHRLQHSILHHMGPILIVLSRPLSPLAAGLPIGLRTRAKNFAGSRTTSFLMNPVLVTATFIGLIYFWLIPHIHFIAMLDWRIYRLMNWSMVLNGLMFWWLALGPSYRPHALSPGTRILMMLAIIPPQIIIGAIIFYASHNLYPLYTLCGRAFGGMSAMADQQIGGLILWIMGSMMSIIGSVFIAVREFSSPNRRTSKAPSLLL